MKFRTTFPGKWNKGELTPLLFRNKVINWYNQVQRVKGFIPEHALLVLKNSLTEEAESQLHSIRTEDIKNIKQFFQWFDETFDVTSLRSVLYNELNHWEIDKKTPTIKIVETYEARLKLFDQSGFLATATLKEHTEFTDEQLVHKITRALKQYNKEVYEEFTRQMRSTKDLPRDLNQLKQVLHNIDEIITSRKILFEDPETTQHEQFSYNKRDTITNVGSINNIQYSDYNNNRYGNYNNNNNNNNNWYGNNYDNNNNRYSGRYQQGSRGYRGGYRGSYRGGRGQGRGRQRGGYNNNGNGTNYRGRGGNNRRSRGYRGGYRGNSRGYTSYRGGRQNSRRDYLNNRREFEPTGNPQYFKPILYEPTRCRKCNKWGHREFYCTFMNKYFGSITNNYDQLYNSDLGSGSSSRRTVSSIQHHNEKRHKSSRDSSDDDSENNNNNSEEENNGTFYGSNHNGKSRDKSRRRH